MKSKTPKTKVVHGAIIAPPKPRKSSKNRTSFSKEHPSPNAYPKGMSGNPEGRWPSTMGEHLFSKNAPAILSARCSDEICKAYKIPLHSSNTTAIIARAVLDAMTSSYPTVRASAREWLLKITGEANNIRMDVHSFGGAMVPIPPICFVESDGNGNIRACDRTLFASLDTVPAPLELPAEVLG